MLFNVTLSNLVYQNPYGRLKDLPEVIVTYCLPPSPGIQIFGFEPKTGQRSYVLESRLASLGSK